MKILLPLAAALCAAAASRAQGADGVAWDARITAAAGNVVVRPADGADEAAAEEGMPLEPGDRVLTEAGATAEIALDGGSLIALGENSDFTLEKTERRESSFLLVVGALLAKIEPLGARRLSVRTPTAVLAVRGTEFGVDAQEGVCHVGVFDEGRVDVRGTGGEEILAPNQETSVARGAPPLKAAPLRRFAVRRALMRANARRLELLRRRWRRMPPERRRRLRARMLAKLRDRRLRRKKRAGTRPRRGPGPRGRP